MDISRTSLCSKKTTDPTGPMAFLFEKDSDESVFAYLFLDTA